LSFKEILTVASDFEEQITRLANKIETAKTRGEQLSWKKHRRWYMKLVRNTKSILKKLKNSLKQNPELKHIIVTLESSLKNIFDVNSDTNQKWNELPYCLETLQRFQRELDKKNKLEFDLFPRRDFGVDPKLCFVLMPFDTKFKLVYSKGIKPAIRKAKLIPKRADNIFDIRPVVQDIWEYINKAQLIIADLTEKNPNVFYEVGLSHAVPKRLIILTQKKEDVPFDLQYLRWIPYKNTLSGRKELSNALYLTIKKALS